MAELADERRIDIDCNLEGPVPVVNVAGEIDLSTAQVLRESISKVMAERPVSVVFDLAEVSFMDSSGLSVLLELAANGCAVGLRRPSLAVQRLVEVTGLSDTLQSVP